MNDTWVTRDEWAVRETPEAAPETLTSAPSQEEAPAEADQAAGLPGELSRALPLD